MQIPKRVLTLSGEIDFDSRNPILVQDDGQKWLLEGADHLFIGDYVTVSGIQVGPKTLLVKAVADEEYGADARTGGSDA